jgi:hypothetical protein
LAHLLISRAGPSAPDASLSSLPLLPLVGAHLSVSAAARHCARGPPVSLAPPPLFSRPRAHGPRRQRPLVSGHCRPGTIRRSTGTPLLVPPLPPRVGRAPRPPPHPLPHPPLPKKGPCDATAPRSPFPNSVLTSSTPRANPPSPSHPPHPQSAAPVEFRLHRRRRSPAR